jgi:cytochrome c
MKAISMFELIYICKISPARWVSICLGVFAISVILLLPSSSAVVIEDATSADATRGRQIFDHRCTGCHGFDNDKEGPRLHGVYGRKSGTVPTFKYSDAVKNAGVTWDEVSLDKWLTDPDKFIPDNDMDFHLEKANERADVIAFLKESSGK